ncbi:tyrosine-type recombinase/integrase [Streptomyces sp. NPDC056069]|uniref:tyrosine-type recombinase/integrase n=1 Tax=Streptomyces sp. NPDC056069 TaxID=3345702 RepID=UPI0035D8424B
MGRLWLRALKTAGLRDVHSHDLRHTGNTLAATGGATTRELMQRMGHSSVRAALIYQHLVNGSDHATAAHVDEQIRKVRPREPGEASGTTGTTPLPRPCRQGTDKAQAPGSVPVTWAFAYLPTGGRGRFRTADICFVSSPDGG